jgi:hypothetical protein
MVIACIVSNALDANSCRFIFENKELASCTMARGYVPEWVEMNAVGAVAEHTYGITGWPKNSL